MLVMIEKRVVSWPPCWVADEVKAPPTLPWHRAARPQSASLVEKARHLGGEASEPGTGADDDGIVVWQVVDFGNGCRLVHLVVRFAGDVFRNQLRHPLDVHLGAGLARAFGNRVGHGFDVSVSGIVENQYLGHGRLLRKGLRLR